MPNQRDRKKSLLTDVEVNAIVLAANAAVEGMNLEVLEVTVAAKTLQISLENPREDPTLDEIASASKAISFALDEIEGEVGFLRDSYELEVTSPGIERPLRTLSHFERHVGSLVDIGVGDDNKISRYRILGIDADQGSVRFGSDVMSDEPVSISLGEIVSARTVFEWPSSAKEREKAKVSPKQSNEHQKKTNTR